ncbi:MAG: TolC family protein [Myxococcota bacterium]
MRRLTFAPVLAAVMLTSAQAAATTCPSEVPLDWSNVTKVAGSIWEDTSGQAWETRKTGTQRANNAVPGRLRALEGSVAGEFNTQGQSAINEYIADATLTIQLGQLQRQRHARFEAEERAIHAEARADKSSYVYSVQEAFVVWRAAALERRHLEDFLVEATEELEPVRKAHERDLVTDLDLADLESETARLRAELTDARRASEFARATLLARLGRDCALTEVDTEPLDIEEMPSLDSRDNPWRDAIEKVEALPAVQARRARTEAMRAEASVLTASEPLEMSVGGGFRSVGFEENFLIGTLGFALPLARPGSMESALRSSEASAADHEIDWMIQRSRAELRARADRYEALLASYARYSDELLESMRQRVELAEQALVKGHIEMDRLIRARRDLHEAFHRVVSLYTEIKAHHLRADALEAWLEPPGSAER